MNWDSLIGIPLRTLQFVGWAGVFLMSVAAVRSEDSTEFEPIEKEPTSDLPAYPRVSLGDLKHGLGLAASPQPSEVLAGIQSCEDGEPFVVLGMAAQVATGSESDLFCLRESAAICCAGFAIRFPVQGALPEPFKPGDQMAIYGTLREFEGTSPSLKVGREGSMFVMDVEGCVIVPELIVSAERLIQRDNVVELIAGESVSIFARALRESGVGDALRLEVGVTVFAPVDAAFDWLSSSDVEGLFQPANRDRLRRLVLGHIGRGEFRERELFRNHSLIATTGENLDITVTNGSLRVAGARLLFEDMRGGNGVVHLVDRLLVPKDVLLDEATRAIR